MPNLVKDRFVDDLEARFPSLRRLPDSQSLFELADRSARIYVRYSKVHPGGKTFFGLRQTDLRKLEGSASVIGFLWDGQETPLLVPFAAFEDVFAAANPAQDGQYKVQVYLGTVATELYIASSGRFNVDSYFGWNELNTPLHTSMNSRAGSLTHPQVQTLLAAIGHAKGNDIWLPISDRSALDWTLTREFPLHHRLPPRFEAIESVLAEVDVVWIKRGGGELSALFEVEHSTSIYSGLLRFNDVHLTAPELHPRFSIVANDTRRSLYARQINRPTFQRSGLGEVCTFMQYENVLDWHDRLTRI